MPSSFYYRTIVIASKSKQKNLQTELYLDQIKAHSTPRHITAYAKEVNRYVVPVSSIIHFRRMGDYLLVSAVSGVYLLSQDGVSQQIVSIGDGPRQIKEPSLIHVLSETSFQIYDNKLRRVKRYALSPDYSSADVTETYHLPDFMALQALFPGPNQLIGLTGDKQKYGLTVGQFDQAGFTQLNHTALAEPSGMPERYWECSRYLLSGRLTMSKDKIIQVLTFAGLVNVFDRAGNFLYQFPTREKAPLQKGKRIETNAVIYCTREPGFPVNFSITTHESSVAILSNIVLSTDQHQRSLDFYAIETGAYEGSVHLPDLEQGEQPRSAFFIDDTSQLYVEYDEGIIIKYDLEKVAS